MGAQTRQSIGSVSRIFVDLIGVCLPAPSRSTTALGEESSLQAEAVSWGQLAWHW